MILTQEGLDLLKRWEGLRLQPYRDVAGNWTIGYGHLIDVENEQHLLRPEGISKAHSEALFLEDLREAERGVRNNLEVDVTPNQYSALVSFTYNLGSGNLARSTLLRCVNDFDFSGAAAEFEKWSYAGGEWVEGLFLRRKAERDLFVQFVGHCPHCKQEVKHDVAR